MTTPTEPPAEPTAASQGDPGDLLPSAVPGDTQPAQGGTGKRTRTTEAVPGSNHGSAEIERGLVAVALEDGSTRRAERLLAEQGKRISESTLRRWRDDLYATRYLEINRDILPRLNAYKAEQHDALATKANELNHRILDRLEAEYKDLPVRDLPGAARNVSTVSGIHSDKSVNIRAQDNGNAVTAGRNIKDILNALKEKKISVEVVFENQEPDAIEGTAEEQE
jgi:hypothetical protein